MAAPAYGARRAGRGMSAPMSRTRHAIATVRSGKIPYVEAATPSDSIVPSAAPRTTTGMSSSDRGPARGARSGAEPAQLAPTHRICPCLEREHADERDEECAADVLLERERHGRDRAGGEEAERARATAREEEERERAEDGKTRIGVIEG